MNAIDWSKAPPHATHWCPGNAKIEAGWIYNPGGTKGEFYSCYADRGLEHIPAFPDWRKSRLVQRPPKQPWAGEGLPPVGAVCEVDYCESWQRCEVIAHFSQRCGMVAAFTVEFSDGAKSLDAFSAEHFRPARTAEQIAAEEREHKIRNACTAISKALADLHESEEPTAVAIIEAMIDAGYSKQVMP